MDDNKEARVEDVSNGDSDVVVKKTKKKKVAKKKATQKKKVIVKKAKVDKKNDKISGSDIINTLKDEALKLQKDIGKQYNRSVLKFGTEVSKDSVARFSTDSFNADFALGGGVPAHRFTLFWGEESTFKTGMALKVMADAQARNRITHEYHGMKRLYIEDQYQEVFNQKTGQVLFEHKESGQQLEVLPLLFTKTGDDVWELEPVTSTYVNIDTGEMVNAYRCVIVDIEGTYDASWFEALGGIPEALHYSAPDYGEQAIDVIQGMMNAVDRTKKINGRHEDFLYDVFTIDSLAMIATLDEIEDSSEKNKVGTQARLLNSAIRKWNADKNKRAKPPTFLLINQRREKITMFGNPDTVPGGKGQRFVTSTEVRTKRSNKIFSADADKQYPIYEQMMGIVNKNKTAPPKIEYSFNIAVNDYDPEAHDGEKKYPCAFRKGEILEHDEIIKKAYNLGLMGKDEEKKKFFVKLPSQSVTEFFDRKTDLVNTWIYQNKDNYRKVKVELINIYTS